MNLVTIVLPVFLVIALGYALRRLRFVAPATDTALSRLVFYVAAPALLLRSTARTPLQALTALPTLAVLAAVSVAMAVGTYLVAAHARPARRGVIAQGAHRSNMVFLGLPVVANAHGEAGLAVAAVVIGFMVMFYNLLAVLVLTVPHQGLSARSVAVWRDTLVKMGANPLVLGCAGGLFLSVSGLALPPTVDRFLEMVGRIALPLALISVGVGLDFGQLRAELAVTSAVGVLKLIVYPAAVWLGLRAVGLQGLAVDVPVLLMAAPTAVTSYIMAREMNGDEHLAGAIVIGTTVASLVSYMGWLLVLRAV